MIPTYEEERHVKETNCRCAPKISVTGKMIVIDHNDMGENTRDILSKHGIKDV